jgi:MerR family transcriptional regulator, copper efflux regulator
MQTGPIPLRVRGRDGRGFGGKTLRVGDLAKQTGKTVRALHLYEELGLLVPVERSKGGYRLYDADSVLRVSWISKLQDMGFSLSEIKTIVEEFEHTRSAPNAMHRVDLLFRDKLAETRVQIAKLKALEAELESSLSYLDGCGTCDPSRLLDACNACDVHEPVGDAPTLVAGFHTS